MKKTDELGKEILLKIYQPFEKVCGNNWHIEEQRTTKYLNEEFELRTSLYWNEKDDGYSIEINSCKAYVWDIETGIIQLGFEEEGDNVLDSMVQNESMAIFFKKGLYPSHIVIIEESDSNCYLDQCAYKDEKVSIYCFSEKNKKEILEAYNKCQKEFSR